MSEEDPLLAAGLTYEDESEDDDGGNDDDDDDDDFVADTSFGLSPGSPSMRADHLQTLLMKKKTAIRYLDQKLVENEATPSPRNGARAGNRRRLSTDEFYLSDSTKERARQEIVALQKVERYLKEMRKHFDLDKNTVEVHLKDFSYTVQVKDSSVTSRIQTVYNQGVTYRIMEGIRRKLRGIPAPTQTSMKKIVLDNINLVLKPSTMYLVLGPPGSGKTSLLRAIARRLSKAHGETVSGSVTYNGISLDDDSVVYLENAISFVGQTDFHAPRLTVEETLDFGWQCKTGGTHASDEFLKDIGKEGQDLIRRLDAEGAAVRAKMDALELSHVSQTFVGSSDVRGVSGGQRRRVSAGEMPLTTAPVLCGDELSTGLDAASTYQLIYLLMHYTRLQKMTRIISLLQPSPETISLFDEVILLAKGKILYAGPVGNVKDYFEKLGYQFPTQMDIGDALQMVSTEDGKDLFCPSKGQRNTAYSIDELADKFCESYAYRRIEERLRPYGASFQRESWSDRSDNSKAVMLPMDKKYANSFFRSVWLLLKRNIIIWLRDRRFLIVNLIKNVVMGVSVGGVFFQTDSIPSIFGALFQLNLFIMLGAMTVVPEQVTDRSIYYKHNDSNFYGPFPYVVARALALIPQTFIDIMIFGSIIYVMVGLSPTMRHYFIYIALLFIFSLVMNQMLSISAAFSKTKTGVQGFSSCILFLLVLTCGFIVTPDNLTVYTWIYWWSPLAWTYRALLVNEFQSSRYDGVVDETGQTIGEHVLVSSGFFDINGNAFTRDWIAYAFAYMVPYLALCVVITGLCLKYVRVEAVGNGSTSMAVLEHDEESKPNDIVDSAMMKELPFKPVTLTFENVCYDVTTPKTKNLRLLHNVDGIFAPGRMCALMGSSGAGKSTLMDVLALRKTSGTVTGDIRVNGFPQDAKSFRRCSGYVEQFDVQAPELTVSETVLFSARLRLDPGCPVAASEVVDYVLRRLELEAIRDCLVGDVHGGLSFEQRKRLSIAIELAASPSILFLDEPTSGLEARAALLVAKLLRGIADDGRTIISTIHQPSLAVFELFDDLLLLKKGGYVVYCDELGPNCSSVVNYFESLGVRQIDIGENPASWMLTAAVGSEMNFIDFPEEYKESESYARLKRNLHDIVNNAISRNKISFQTEFAASRRTRRRLVNSRLTTIYWRSPAYNRLRMMVYLGLALALGCVFLPETFFEMGVYTETEISSLLATTFVSFIFTGVLAINSVLPVMLKIRDSFYRHRKAGMVDDVSLVLALGVAEKWFILFTSVLFCVVFLPCAGIGLSPGPAIGFAGIFCFNTAIYSYFGQAFMCLVPGMHTAQILTSIFIGLNNFFSGLIVRPQFCTGFFAVPFWITPGHYVFEGLVVCLFSDDATPVIATPGSQFYRDLGCTPDMMDGECVGTAWDYVETFFGGKYQRENLYYDAIILGVYLVLARASTFFALKYCTFTAN